jgi:hypothetical protein
MMLMKLNTTFTALSATFAVLSGPHGTVSTTKGCSGLPLPNMDADIQPGSGPEGVPAAVHGLTKKTATRYWLFSGWLTTPCFQCIIL